jgi:hypothetical protein
VAFRKRLELLLAPGQPQPSPLRPPERFARHHHAGTSTITITSPSMPPGTYKLIATPAAAGILLPPPADDDHDHRFTQIHVR